MLKETFFDLVNKFCADPALRLKLWTELEVNYSSAKRHYHTFHHLESLLHVLRPVRDVIQDWDTMMFTLFYHDAVYVATKSDNEEKSAALAVERMSELGVPREMIDRCKSQILATKKHLTDINEDTNYFTDADLSVLGLPWPAYQQYALGVRKEYSMYPDLLYRPGRHKVLKHFLNMPRIFKTDYFFAKFDEHARQNLKRELQTM
jgi:predicted metal-dependent HD superfamily phosphohydrolase